MSSTLSNPFSGCWYNLEIVAGKAVWCLLVDCWNPPPPPPRRQERQRTGGDWRIEDDD